MWPDSLASDSEVEATGGKFGLKVQEFGVSMLLYSLEPSYYGQVD